jgi:hypothetical protein
MCRIYLEFFFPEASRDGIADIAHDFLAVVVIAVEAQST